MVVTQLSRPTAYVDFNDVEEDGRIPVAFDDFTGLVPAERALVHLRDEEGNECDGLVVGIEDEFVMAIPLWQTWSAAIAIRPPSRTVFVSQPGATTTVEKVD